MNEVLLIRDFKWRVVLSKIKNSQSDKVTTDVYKKSVDAAISTLPEDLIVTEVVLETECIQKKGEKELKTIIYWKE